MMTYEEIRQAIATHMVEWTGISAKNIDYANSPKPFDPTGMDVWARLTAIPEMSSTPEMGFKPCIRRSGTAAIQLFVPSNTGDVLITKTATSLAEHFELFQSGHLEFMTSEMVTIGDEGSGWYQVNLNIRYRTI